MDDAAIDRLLAENGVGVLSMSVDDVPYAIPLSFGYDGSDRLYFLFVGRSEELKKERYAAESTVVNFLVYEIQSIASWRSAIVTGPLERIEPDEWVTAREALADNAFRADIFADFDRNADPNVWALEIESRSGRVTGPS